MAARDGLLPLTLGLLVLAGFTPRMVHRLEATDPAAGEWDRGRLIRDASADGIEASVAYVRTDPTDHVFWVRVTNFTADTVLVNPAAFVLTAFPSTPAYRLGEGGTPAAARDPEAELLEVDVAASKADARARTRAGVALVSAALVTTAAVADPPDTEAEEADLAYAYASIEADAAGAAWDRAAAEGRREAGRIYWEGVFRKTTLPPNTYMDGVVHAPVDGLARAVVFEVVVGEVRVPFAFRQVNIRP